MGRMSGENILPGVDRLPHDSLRDRYERHARMHEERLSRSRRRAAGVTAGVLAVGAALGGVGYLAGERQTQLNRSSEEMTALVRQYGYISAEAFKPKTGDEAYITLRMSNCEAGKADILIDNVTATLWQATDGVGIQKFSRDNGEKKVAGQWLQITQTWLTPDELCAQENNK